MEARVKDSATAGGHLKAKLEPSPGLAGAQHLSERCRVGASATSRPLGFNGLRATAGSALSSWASVQASKSGYVETECT